MVSFLLLHKSHLLFVLISSSLLLMHTKVKSNGESTSRPRVNFTIILLAAFTRADPNSTKNTVKSSSFLRFWDLLAYTLMKLTPSQRKKFMTVKVKLMFALHVRNFFPFGDQEKTYFYPKLMLRNHLFSLVMCILNGYSISEPYKSTVMIQQ